MSSVGSNGPLDNTDFNSFILTLQERLRSTQQSHSLSGKKDYVQRHDLTMEILTDVSRTLKIRSINIINHEKVADHIVSTFVLQNYHLEAIAIRFDFSIIMHVICCNCGKVF